MAAWKRVIYQGMSRGITIIFTNITTITIIISTIITAVLVEREWSKARGLSNGRWPEVATTTILGMGSAILGWAYPRLGLSWAGPIPGWA